MAQLSYINKQELLLNGCTKRIICCSIREHFGNIEGSNNKEESVLIKEHSINLVTLDSTVPSLFAKELAIIEFFSLSTLQ